MPALRSAILATLLLATTAIGPKLTLAQNSSSKLPSPATKASLQNYLTEQKAKSPKTPQEYLAMQQAIRDASKALLRLLDAERDAQQYQLVEFDAIASTVALMATEGEDAKKKTTEQIHAFLKRRKRLELPDLSTGLQAAMLLELQPNKQPARETYQLLLEMTKDDSRPEILGLRYQIEGSIRRLDLLGKALSLEATSLDGKLVKIGDYSGKYVLINFFIRGSRSCEAVIPALRKYAEKYSDELAVIAIAVDQDPEALAKYVQTQEFPWPVIHDNDSQPQERLHHKYGVSAFPLVLLLNKVGEVVSLEAHSSELDRIMQMLFEAPTLAPSPASSSTAPSPAKDPASATAPGGGPQAAPAKT